MTNQAGPKAPTTPGPPAGSRSGFAAALDFELDTFQEQALDSLDQGRSVLVAAPTGSGKTVVAEYAVARALAEGGKAFYTTPLKALSNQKYADLTRLLGPHQVGLLTGDNSVNGEAPVVVMTTEVLRNMIYAGSPVLADLRVVVLDEVHYLQNPYRGAVWEEVIIHAPDQVRLVCLSATVSNAEQFAAWVGTVRGATTAVIEEHRPVQLHQLYMVGDRSAPDLHLLPAFVDGRPNSAALALDSGTRRRSQGLGRRRLFPPRRTEVVERLAAEAMLPAIYFIFSRAACDDAVRRCLDDGVRLTSAEERRQIRAVAEAKVEGLSDADLRALDYGRWLTGLEAGLAAHHAGLVPPFKEAVETCFTASLVKVVFATETLSLGINMPARSVVIEKLTKFTGEGHDMVTPGEYTQLTGRAGRRGIDEVGYAVVLWSPFVSFEQVARLASTRSYALCSSFRPTYNMAANLVRRYRPDQARHLVNLSFAQYQSDADVVHLEAQLDKAKAALAQGNERRATEVRRLKRRIKARTESLARQFDKVLAVLEGWGFVSDWALTDAGHRLTRIYHEADLLIARALGVGLFDGLDAAGVAGLASVFTFEARGSAPAPPPRFPSPGLLGRWKSVESLSLELTAIEKEVGVPPTRGLDPGFMAAAVAWVSGGDLAKVIAQQAMSGGDFVRNVKQLIDLLRQLGEVAPDPVTARTARQAADGLFRGVVAASSVVDAHSSQGLASSVPLAPG